MRPVRTFARPPLLGQNFKEIWVPRKLEVRGWVTERTKIHPTGIDDGKVKEDQLAHLMTKEAKDVKGRGRGKQWSVCGFITYTCKLMIIEVLKMVKKDLADNN